MKYFIKLLLAAAILTISTLITSTAHATSGNITSPFDIGTTWYVCQGYNGPITHSGTSAYALDLMKDLCDGSSYSNASSSGATVRALLDGTVYWNSPAYGALCVNTLDNRSYTTVHIDSSLSPGANIVAGQKIGAISAPGTRGNAGVSHLHLQIWNAPNCNSPQSQQPFSTSANAQICGAPDMTAIGPNAYNNGTWSGTNFISEDCAGENPPVYRMYNLTTKHHLLTSDSNEVLTLRSARSWIYEGISFRVKSLSACKPNESVYRFYSQSLKTHLYTIDENEKNTIIATFPKDIWQYEGISYYATN